MTDINALDQEQRDRAYHNARTRIAGPLPAQHAEPQLRDFLRADVSRYSPEYKQRMRWLGYIILAAAFLGSAIRIFLAAFETNADYLGATQTPAFTLPFVLAVLIGLSSVLLAESGQVAFTLWESSIEGSGWMRYGLRFGAWACAAFALIANAYIVHPWTHLPDAGAFALAAIETLLPPVLVLIASNVLKKQILDENADRHHAQTLYAQAHADWQTQHEAALAAWSAAFANAHQHPDWMSVLANCLRDALRAANRRSYAKLRELTNEDWRRLVLREMNAENWYSQTQPPALQQPVEQPAPTARRTQTKRVQTHSGRSSGTHTGEYDAAVTVRADGVHVGTCPYCQREFTAPTARGAKGALVAHGKHCQSRTQMDVDVIRAAQAVISEVRDGE